MIQTRFRVNLVMLFCISLSFRYKLAQHTSEVCNFSCVSGNYVLNRHVEDSEKISVNCSITSSECTNTKHSTSECGIGRTLSDENAFLLNWIKVDNANDGHNLEFSWSSPVIDHFYDSRNLPALWMMNVELLVNEGGTKCYTFSFSPRELQFLQGNFNIPCIKINQHQSLVVKIWYYIQKSQHLTSQIVRFQEVPLSPYVLSNREIVNVWQSNLKCFIRQNELFILLGDAIPSHSSSFELVVSPTDSHGQCISHSSQSLQKWTWNKQNYRKEFKMELYDLESCKLYCIQVSLKQQNGNEINSWSVYKETVFIKTPSWTFEEKLLEEGHWNASILIEAHSAKKEVTVTFCVMNPAKHIFRRFEMYLFQIFIDNCNEGDYSQNLKFSLEPGASITQSFFNVSPGKYCVKVVPIDEFCERHLNVCGVLNSYPVTVKDDPTILPLVPKPSTSKANQDIWPKVVIPIVCIIMALFGAWGLIYLKRRKSKHKKPLKNDDLEGNEMNKPFAKTKVCPFVLYAHDEDTAARITALKHILKSAADINLDFSQPHLMAICGGGTIQSAEYTKVIVVETDRAIELQNKHQCAVFGSPQSIMEEFHKDDRNAFSKSPPSLLIDTSVADLPLENHFVGELTSLTSDLVKSLKDYCHFFVIQFSDKLPTLGKLKNLVPNERYILPNQLLQLCIDLLDESQNIDALKERLDSAVAEHWSF